MGYRSELYIKMHKEFQPEFKFFLTVNGADLSLDTFEEKNPGEEEYAYYYASYLKWYSGYKEVDKFNTFILDNASHIGMIRIGEDNSDVEEYGEPWDLDLTYYTETIVEGF